MPPCLGGHMSEMNRVRKEIRKNKKTLKEIEEGKHQTGSHQIDQREYECLLSEIMMDEDYLSRLIKEQNENIEDCWNCKGEGCVICIQD